MHRCSHREALESAEDLARRTQGYAEVGSPWHFLNLRPEPQGQGSFRPASANFATSASETYVVVCAPVSEGAEY